MTTSTRIVFIVVLSIALLAAMGLAAIAWCTLQKIEPGAALVTITSSLTGALTALLVSLRSQTTPPPSDPPAPPAPTPAAPANPV